MKGIEKATRTAYFDGYGVSYGWCYYTPKGKPWRYLSEQDLKDEHTFLTEHYSATETNFRVWLNQVLEKGDFVRVWVR